MREIQMLSLPITIFFALLSLGLQMFIPYERYANILKWLTLAFGFLFQKTMGLGGASALAVAANIFLGMIESPIVIRAYLDKLTRSEIFLMMVVGLATVAGSTMVAYASILAPVLPNAAGHVLVASIVSAPAGVLLALAVVAGGAMGVGLEHILLLMLKPVLPAALPAASGWPWLWAIGAMVVISLLVGLRPYRLLLATLPLRVLRQDVVANVWPLTIYIPVVCAVVVALLALLMGGSPLLWAVLAGAVVLALLCGLAGWGVLWLLKRLTLKALPLRLAVNRLLRQPWSTLSQLAAFSLSFMLLALLLVLRGDLLDRWQQQLPPESPNYFLINIAPEQVVPVKTFLAEHQTRATEFYPIVRARLTQINGQVTEGNKDEALNRELNLTWSPERQDGTNVGGPELAAEGGRGVD